MLRTWYARALPLLDSVSDVYGSELHAFLTDFPDARKRAAQLDQQLVQNATAAGGSENYSDLVSLAARQAFGAIDITVAEDDNGQWNTSDTMIFMKNMGGGVSRYAFYHGVSRAHALCSM